MPSFSRWALIVLPAVVAYGVFWWTSCGPCCRTKSPFGRLAATGDVVSGPDYVVAITGASSGIGAEVARQYAARGVRLALAARRQAALEQVAAECSKLGAADVLIVQADMGNVSQAVGFVETTASTFGRLDVMLLNHAAFQHSLFSQYASADELSGSLERIFRVNVVGTTSAAWAAVPHLAASSGRLVLTSSGSRIAPTPFHGAYGASKAAADTILTSYAIEAELLQLPVSMSSLVLGLIGTDANLHESDAIAAQAMPVEECAADMVCAVDRRDPIAYIPQFLSPYATLVHAAPSLLTRILKANYLDLSARMTSELHKAAAAMAARVQAIVDAQ